jgi:hypothetical protein
MGEAESGQHHYYSYGWLKRRSWDDCCLVTAIN